MAIPYFSPLASEEQELLFQTPALVVVLIAGADHDIDEKEEALARKLVGYRTFTSDERLHAYYELVHDRFENDLKSLLQNWKAGEGEEQMSEILSQLNAVLPKIDETHARLLKESWRSLARKVAEASGGLLGFGSVNKDELKLVDLPMIL
jgi:hypothetical protein